MYLYEKFTNKSGAQTRLATNNQIRITAKIKTDLGLNNFTYIATNQWNQLPAHIKQSPTLYKFKINAKKWINENIAI